MRSKVENAVISEIYGKHDGGPRFFFSNQSARFIKAKSSASRDTEKALHTAIGDRMT